VSLYSNSLGVAISQSTYATDAGGEIEALRQLLDWVELEGPGPIREVVRSGC
jgi:hypothetical protein